MTDQELVRLLSQAAPMARDLWLSSLPGDGELPQARPSPAFQRRMDRLIRRMGRSPGGSVPWPRCGGRRRWRWSFWRWASRA